ncbi:hypothetical protein H5410_021558 [Solanum commersonii]|uniref:Uncharacterized protein n=1 Tax=Solanum commersonii TaxID=4109 RepID=A0A9J5ZCX4_SOLCO|nr:hypothetical protein H5410_021558 [Solanum commersonii]
MTLLYQLYFDVVHKIILQRKQTRMQEKFLGLTIMVLLEIKVPIDLPSLIINHMHKVFNHVKNGHALPYRLWMTSIFEAFDVPVQAWNSKTVKGVVGQVNHMALPASMRRLDTSLQHLKNQLAEKENELAAMTSAIK